MVAMFIVLHSGNNQLRNSQLANTQTVKILHHTEQSCLKGRLLHLLPGKQIINLHETNGLSRYKLNCMRICTVGNQLLKPGVKI